MNRKLGRKSDHRNHMIRNLVSSLVLYERIDTTEAKAKEVKQALDQIIARSKGQNLVGRRKLISFFFDRNAAKKVVEELLPRYENRSSGFVKSYHLANRLGDNASMMRLELVDHKVFVDTAKVKVSEPKEKVDNEDKE